MELVRFKPSYRYDLKQRDFTGDGHGMFLGFCCWFFVAFVWVFLGFLLLVCLGLCFVFFLTCLNECLLRVSV